MPKNTPGRVFFVLAAIATLLIIYHTVQQLSAPRAVVILRNGDVIVSIPYAYVLLACSGIVLFCIWRVRRARID